MTTSARFNLIGPGRAGVSVSNVLVDVGWELNHVYDLGEAVTNAALEVELCIVATPDSVISEVAASVDPGEAVLLHLSGATPLSALPHARRATLHPLLSMADPEIARVALRDAYFAVAGDPIAREIATAVSGKWFEIEDADRALYHCAAAIASNHLVALLGQVERIAESLGIPFEAYAPLISASLENTLAMSPASALTGPAARGDEATLDKHRAALRGFDPSELPGYEVMVALAQRLAEDGD